MNIPFAETWCILNLESQQRIENMKHIERNYHIDNIHYMYTYAKPYYVDNIHEQIPSIRTDWYDLVYDEYNNKYNKDIYKNIYDCFANHYNIIKQAYLRGLDSILIIEDDIKFVTNENVINEVFKKIPEDYDIIKFYNGNYHTHIAYADNIKFEIQNNKLQCTVIYALSKNGMKKYLDYFDSNPPLPADMVFCHLIDKYKTKIYSLVPQIVYHTSDYSTIVNK